MCYTVVQIVYPRRSRLTKGWNDGKKKRQTTDRRADQAGLSYEQAYEQLQQIVEQIEQGQVGLEESVARYEDSMKLIAHCRRILQQAEQKVLQLQQNEHGEPVLQPLEVPQEKESQQADEQ